MFYFWKADLKFIISLNTELLLRLFLWVKSLWLKVTEEKILPRDLIII